MPKKTERGDPLGFFNIHSVANYQKNAGGTLWGKIFFEKKSRSAEKNERGESLVSPGMVCYAEKQEKPFRFSSLDQIVHFDAIIFCRTFVELFWSVRVDRKKSHYNSRVSLHEAPTKKKDVDGRNRQSEIRCYGRKQFPATGVGERGIQLAQRITPQKIRFLINEDAVSRWSCNSIWMRTEEYPSIMSMWRKFQSSARTALCQRRIHPYETTKSATLSYIS